MLASGDLGPAGLDLDADGAPVERGGLDDGGADAGHDVDDDLAGGRVLGDDAPGELGEHLGRVLGALGQVTAGPLVLGGGLSHGPDSERHGGTGGTAGGGGCGHGRPTTEQASPKEQGVRASFSTNSRGQDRPIQLRGHVEKDRRMALRSSRRRR